MSAILKMKADLNVYLWVFSGSFIVFLYFFRKLSSISSSQFPKFCKLSQMKQMEWNDRNNSTVHALVSSAISLYFLLTDKDGYSEPLWGASWLTEAGLCVSIGYSVADTLWFVATYPTTYDGYWEVIIHHLCMSAQYAISIKYSVYCYLVVFRTLAEMSTPFVNFRWMLAECDMQKTKIYVYNGFLLALVFFLCRIAVMPYAYIRILASSNPEGYKRLGNFRYCILLGVVLDVLNIVWFHKIFRGFMKYFGLSSWKTKSQ